MLSEKICRLDQAESGQPAIEQCLSSRSVEHLDDCLIGHLLNVFENLRFLSCEILLQSNSLGDCMASHSLLLHLFQEVDSLLLSFNTCLPNEVLSPLSQPVHEVRLEEVVILVKLKALMKQCGVYFVRKPHQPHSFVFYLGNKCFVILVLSCNQLGEEVLSVGFSDSFRLVVKNVREIIVIFLLCPPDFDEWQEEHS